MRDFTFFGKLIYHDARIRIIKVSLGNVHPSPNRLVVTSFSRNYSLTPVDACHILYQELSETVVASGKWSYFTCMHVENRHLILPRI